MKAGTGCSRTNTNGTISIYSPRYQYFNRQVFKKMYCLESWGVSSRNLMNHLAASGLNSIDGTAHFSRQRCLSWQTTLPADCRTVPKKSALGGTHPSPPQSAELGSHPRGFEQAFFSSVFPPGTWEQLLCSRERLSDELLLVWCKKTRTKTCLQDKPFSGIPLQEAIQKTDPYLFHTTWHGSPPSSHSWSS